MIYFLVLGGMYYMFPLLFDMKRCIKCNRTLPSSEFYNEKNICKCCYKRWIRRKSRINKGNPIHTVGELIRELISLPNDTEIFICDDISLYHPTTVEFIRGVFKGNKNYDTELYNNCIVIV